MTTVRNISKEDRKMRQACMNESWTRHKQDPIYIILSFEDGAWCEYKGVQLVTEEPELSKAIFKDQLPDRTAYEEGRAWMREFIKQKNI